MQIKNDLNEGDIYSEQTPATFFHHTWIPQDDTLSYPLSINVFPKRRGRPTGPDLPNTNIQELTITKRLGSRVLGQLWILSGAFAGPIMATAKCLFSLLCTFLTDWTTPLEDQDLRNQYLEFLTALATRYHELQPWPRLLIPHGYTAVSMHLHGDGSAHLASATLYLVSAKLTNDTQIPLTLFQCWWTLLQR